MRHDEADAGEPFRRAQSAADTAESCRSGAAALFPTAPTESERGEDGEQRKCDNGHDRFLLISSTGHRATRSALSRTATAAMTERGDGVGPRPTQQALSTRPASRTADR